jgi:hypothetical protein
MLYSFCRAIRASFERSFSDGKPRRRRATYRPGVEFLENRITPAGTGQQQVYALDGAAGDNFGTVAIDQNTAVIGAPGHASSRGAVYVFTRIGSFWSQAQELTALDGAANDLFGTSVAVNGNTIVVGASGHQVGSRASQGAAYVYVLSGGTWTLQQELTAPDGAANDAFGYSVAINGNTLVVGAWTRTLGSNAHQGVAYVFARVGSLWTQQGPDLISHDGATNDNFGSAVAIQGSTVVVGADGHPGSTMSQGAAYVFGLQGGTWTQQQELDVLGSNTFGKSVALDGNTIVIGSSGDQVGSNPSQGAAYVFALQGSSWTEQQKLTSQDGAANDDFGESVGISGNTVLIGAGGHLEMVKGEDIPLVSGGAAYVFVNNGGLWTQEQELTVSILNLANEGFGTSVALSGDTVVVGAPLQAPTDAPQGAAYFTVVAGQQEVTAADGAANDAFGESVAIDGNTAVIGAGTGQSAGSPGAAYLFTRNGTVWTQQQKLTPSDSSSGDDFGASVALSGNTLVIGAPGKSGGGEVYVFTLNGNTWMQQQEFTDHLGLSAQRFGLAVAISGNAILVGDGNYSTPTLTNGGAAYLFTRSGGLWEENEFLPGSMLEGNFGLGVAITGNTVVVGANSGDANVYQITGLTPTLTLQQALTGGQGVVISGSTIVTGTTFFGPPVGISGPNPHGEILVYKNVGGTWTPQQVMNGTFGMDEFVASLAITVDTIAVGTTFGAYVFKLEGSTWMQQQNLSAGDGVIGVDVFGESVALGGDTVLVGAPGHQVGSNASQGAAYFQTPSLAYSVADFQGHGVWRYDILTGWQQLTPADASLVAADDDGSVAATFLNGLWLYDDANGWQHLTAAGASQIDIAGNEIVVAEFPGNGLWRHGDPVGAGWQQLTPADAFRVAVDDLGDTVASFQGNGVFLYQDASGWQQLTQAVADQVSIAPSGSNLAADFQGNGVWRYNFPGSGSSPGWQQLTGAIAASVAVGAAGAVACEFGNGVWLYEDSTGWQHLSPVLASQVGSALLDEVFAEFPGNGIWKHTTSGWQQLISIDAVLLRGAG